MLPAAFVCALGMCWFLFPTLSVCLPQDQGEIIVESGGTFKSSGAVVAKTKGKVIGQTGATLTFDASLEVSESTIDLNGAQMTATSMTVNGGSMSTSGATVTVGTMDLAAGSDWVFVNTAATVTQVCAWRSQTFAWARDRCQ